MYFLRGNEARNILEKEPKTVVASLCSTGLTPASFFSRNVQRLDERRLWKVRTKIRPVSAVESSIYLGLKILCNFSGTIRLFIQRVGRNVVKLAREGGFDLPSGG